ncbi:FtsB family cell division protein [Paludifilum halophilum]|nr:septum formation initiator family protein [Paludifilum halophilum]
MVDRGVPTNVVEIRPSSPSSQSGQDSSHRPLPPHVKRRRRIWLIMMIAFFVWGGSELWTQAQRIEAEEAALKEQKEEVASLKAKQDSLKKEINRLHDEQYLMDLARKMGYQKPGEEVYHTP